MTRIIDNIRDEILHERKMGRPMLSTNVENIKASLETDYLNRCKVSVQIGTTFSYKHNTEKNYAKEEIIEQIRRMIYGDFEEDLVQLYMSILDDDNHKSIDLAKKLIGIVRR